MVMKAKLEPELVVVAFDSMDFKKRAVLVTLGHEEFLMLFCVFLLI